MRIYISNGVPEEHTHGPIEDVLDLESQWSYGEASIEKKNHMWRVGSCIPMIIHDNTHRAIKKMN